MPWCPKCKSEYREGFKVCADCGSELVEKETLQESGTQEQADWGIRMPVAEMPVFPETKCGKESGQEQRNVYQNSSERASENRSAAWMLLIAGAIGLLILVLGLMGIVPLKFGNSYLFCGVMAAIFILFLAAGVASMKNARIFEKKAKSENSLRDTMLDWCKDNLHAEDIDRQLGRDGSQSQEILYFMRFECIKAKLNHQFVNLDQAFLDNFIDEYVYNDVFKEESGEERVSG